VGFVHGRGFALTLALSLRERGLTLRKIVYDWGQEIEL